MIGVEIRLDRQQVKDFNYFRDAVEHPSRDGLSTVREPLPPATYFFEFEPDMALNYKIAHACRDAQPVTFFIGGTRMPLMKIEQWEIWTYSANNAALYVKAGQCGI